METNELRSEFEAHVKSTGYWLPISRSGTGYDSNVLQAAWEAYQAGYKKALDKQVA